MNKQIRRLGLALMVGFVVLFAQLNYIQVFRSEELNTRPGNFRPIERAFSRPRGTISSADGVELARSQPIDDRFEYLRVYPEGALFGEITGYFNYSFGASGVEQFYNEQLSGTAPEQQFRSFSDLFVEKDRSGNVTLTLRKDLQQLARDTLGDREGSIVVMDPRSGDILAFWNNPSYDPNPLSAHASDPAVAESAIQLKRLLDADPDSPLLAGTYQQRYSPGSTFKVVTGSIGLETGVVTQDQPSYPQLRALDLPDSTVDLPNFAGGTCGGTLFEILRDSCNTAFAQMGLEIGPERMIEGSERFGFNDAPPIDLPGPARSVFPTDFSQRRPALAQAAIGQFEVQATPLEMALVASAIANGGEIMVPHVMKEIRDDDGEVIESYEPEVWREAVSDETAGTMRDAMRVVVEEGSATLMQIPGVDVAGKTGTAEAGDDTNHAWIIGFAGPPGQEPQVAVAVILENVTGATTDATGGMQAAPIGRVMLERALAVGAGS